MSNPFSLKGRVALVTGSSRGLGVSTTGINRPLQCRRNPATLAPVSVQKCRHKPASP